jgi:hypothetical protein
MGGRVKYDWEAIKREYRAGQLSISEIAAQFGCRRETISRRATKEGWTRDLAPAVRKAVASKVTRITSQVTDPNVTDDEIIEKAADRGAEVITLHRQDIAALRELEAKLIAELRDNPTKLYLAQYQGQIIEKTVGLTAAERAQAANNLANVQHKRIALERQAFNLNDSGFDDPDAPDSILIRVNRGEKDG